MNLEGWVAFLLVLFFIYPLEVLLHELGHAIAALALTSGPVTIRMGDWRRDTHIFERRWGRLTLRWYRLPGWVGSYVGENIREVSPRNRILIALSGPLMSLLIAVVAYATMFNLESGAFWWDVAQTIGNFAMLSFLFTIIPMRYPALWGAYEGMRSDGATIVEQIRRMRQPAVSSEKAA